MVACSRGVINGFSYYRFQGCVNARPDTVFHTVFHDTVFHVFHVSQNRTVTWASASVPEPAYEARIKANGLAPKAVVGAAMRKLAHLIYGVVKSGKPFDVNFVGRGLAIQDGI